MAFDFFGLRKKPLIQDVEVKVPLPPDSSVEEPVESEQAPKAPAAPVIPVQMDTAKATREDVIAAYKIFLGRVPESMEVVDPRVGVAPAALLVDFLASKEFLDYAPRAQLVLAVAKKILDERKLAKEGVTVQNETQPPV